MSIDIIQESKVLGCPDILSYDCTKKIMKQMENNICKIKIGDEQGTGFFCKIPFPDEKNMLPVFITNNHVIKEEILYKNNKNISIYIKGEKAERKINLNNRIKYTNIYYDITIIEILEKDHINNYLELDDKIISDIIDDENFNIEYKDKTSYIIQYPNGELSVSYGIIDKLFEDKKNIFTFIHKCSTCHGSSGSPILSLNNKVFGIHFGNKSDKYNKGTFLNYPIKDFIKLNYNKISNINESLNISIETNATEALSKEMNKINNNFFKENTYKETSFNEFKDQVNAILTLSDNRLCACSSDCSIKVFDIQNSKFDLKINKKKAHSNYIWCIEEIKKNVLASGGYKDIKIWNIKNSDLELITSKNSAHDDYLNKIIKLNNNNFASCARDGKIKIWSENYNEIECINAHNTYINSILKLNNGMLVSGSNGERALKFWDLNDYSLYKSINNIYSTAYNNTLLEVDNILFVGEKDGIRIFDLENNLRSYFYEDKKLDRILSLFYIGDNILIAGTSTGFIYLYQIIKQPFFTLEKINVIKNNLNAEKGKYNFKYGVSDLTFIQNFDKSFIVSCSIDRTIKTFEIYLNED